MLSCSYSRPLVCPRHERHSVLQSGLLHIYESKLEQAIEEFDLGISKLSNLSFTPSGASEIELSLLLYKIYCWFELGRLSEAQEVMKMLQMNYSKSVGNVALVKQWTET